MTHFFVNSLWHKQIQMHQWFAETLTANTLSWRLGRHWWITKVLCKYIKHYWVFSSSFFFLSVPSASLLIREKLGNQILSEEQLFFLPEPERSKPNEPAAFREQIRDLVECIFADVIVPPWIICSLRNKLILSPYWSNRSHSTLPWHHKAFREGSNCHEAPADISNDNSKRLRRQNLGWSEQWCAGWKNTVPLFRASLSSLWKKLCCDKGTWARWARSRMIPAELLNSEFPEVYFLWVFGSFMMSRHRRHMSSKCACKHGPR